MRKSAKIPALVAILAVVAAIVLYAALEERRGDMPTNANPVSDQPPIQLPRPVLESGTSIEQALLRRQSIREYRTAPITLEEVAQLLWAAQGITHGGNLRTAPSAGALYPLETYVVAGNVTNLPAGVYRYLPNRHELAPMISGDLRLLLFRAALDQDPISNAPASLVISAVFARTTGKYGTRGIRYGHMEAGIAAQNIALQAVSLNLGTVVIGAFQDGEVRQVMSLKEAEQPLLIMPVGRKR